jgi:hypothetical protein
MGVMAVPLVAQPGGVEPPLVTEIFTFTHRQAGQAIGEVEQLLSPRGTVELQPRGNALVIRDSPPAIRRILLRLRGYDRPLRRVRIEIQIVRAGDASVAQEPGSPQLSVELAQRLRELLRFESFALVAQAGLEMREGERIAYQFGGDHRVEFELGVLTANRQLRLGDFIVGRGPASETRPLIHTNLNLTLERPMVLGLAQTEASERALMVVLNCHLLADEPERKD